MYTLQRTRIIPLSLSLSLSPSLPLSLNSYLSPPSLCHFTACPLLSFRETIFHSILPLFLTLTHYGVCLCLSHQLCPPLFPSLSCSHSKPNHSPICDQVCPRLSTHHALRGDKSDLVPSDEGQTAAVLPQAQFGKSQAFIHLGCYAQ